MFLWMVKSFKFIVKTSVLECLAGCVREQKRYQQNIKIDTTIHPQINTNSMHGEVIQKH